MARIDDTISKCIFYLYPSRQDAIDGRHSGGSGFFVGFPSTVFPEEWAYFYAITATHVAMSCPVIRVNKTDDTVAVMDLGVSDWIPHPDGDEIAVACVDPLDDHKIQAFPPEYFVTREILDKEDIGVGDDTFMVGRFISHEGRQRNLPTVRFGNISQMPWEPVQLESGFEQEAFLVETRSIPGYSGSPVSVSIQPMVPRPKAPGMMRVARTKQWLLGIDIGHLPIMEDVVDAGGKPHPDGWRVKSITGMAVVIPAWKIIEHIENSIELKKMREKDEAMLRKKKAENPGAVLDVAKGDGITPDEFDDALRKVSRRLKPSEPDD